MKFSYVTTLIVGLLLLIFDVTAQVGIGTTSPSVHLHVSGSSASFIGNYIDNTNADGFSNLSVRSDLSGINLQSVGSTDATLPGFQNWGRLTVDAASSGMVLQTNGADPMTFNTNSVERIRILSGGNVGIGTTTPTESLDVFPDTDISSQLGRAHVGYVGWTDYAGFSHVDQNATTNYALLQHASGGTFLNGASGQYIRFRINNTDHMILNSAGNIGIGTTAPQSPLEISDVASGINDLQHLEYENAVGSGGYLSFGGANIEYGKIESVIDAANEVSLRFYDYDGGTLNEIMRIDGGNLGVGITAPSAKLHVNGSVRFESNGEAANRILVSDATGVATWQDASAANTNSWQLDGNGSTNPTTDFIGTTDAVDLVVRTNGTERMRISSIGNVGVGSTPDANYNLTVGSSADGEIKLGGTGTVGVANNESGVYWHTTNEYAIKMTQGTWSAPNYQQLLLDWPTGIELNPGNLYGESYVGISNGIDAGLGSGGYLVIGSTTSLNMVMDNNELMARNNGAKSAINLNADGGDVTIHNNEATSAKAIIKDDGKVGLGTIVPSEQLHVVGSIRMVDGAQTAGDIMTSNASGVASWVTPASLGLGDGIYGGDGTTPSDVDVAVTDDIDFDGGTFFIDGTNNRVGVGTTTTIYRFTSTTSFDGDRGVFAENTSVGTSNQYGIYASKSGNTGTANGYGIFASATGTGNWNRGVDGSASGATFNLGCRGVATGGTSAIGSVGSASGASFNYGVQASASGGSICYGLWADAQLATTNYAVFVANGETRITYVNGSVPTRSTTGSIAVSNQGGNRIYYRTSGGNYYVNSSGTGDYSEYFRRNDSTLKIGEIVAIDPSNHNGVRKADAKKGDGQRIMGIVSKYGTQNNNTNDGDRYLDSSYVNVGLIGQVQLKVSIENGVIKPGDALTLSLSQPGLAVRATKSCRIIGYAMTHYPYVKGEVTYPTHSGAKGKEDNLGVPHVMVYVQAGHWEKEKKEDSFSKETNLRAENELQEIKSTLSEYKQAINELMNQNRLQQEKIDELGQKKEDLNYVTEN